jgi:putative redox protein
MTSTPPASPKPPSRVHVAWAGGERFDAGRPGGPTLRLDGTGETGQSPVDALLSALASCTAVDVVEILAKRRTPVASLTVDAVGERADAVPARFTRITLHYRIAGAGIEHAHAERAIELAVTKYCSVRSSLDPAMPVEWTLELEG